MKKQTLFLFLPIFLVFFAWGLQIGDHLSEEPYPSVSDSYILEKDIPVLPNGQKSLLIGIVTEITTPKPDLLGLWLITYFSSEPYTTVIPLFPTSKDNEINFTEAVSSSFQLKNNSEIPLLEDKFLLELNKANIWTSGYIIMDLFGFAEAINMSGGINHWSNYPEGEVTVETITRLLNNKSSLTYQTLLFQEICAHFTLMNSFQDLQGFRALFPEHLSSNLDPDILMNDWKNFLKSRNGSFCVFPLAEQTAQIGD